VRSKLKSPELVQPTSSKPSPYTDGRIRAHDAAIREFSNPPSVPDSLYSIDFQIYHSLEVCYWLHFAGQVYVCETQNIMTGQKRNVMHRDSAKSAHMHCRTAPPSCCTVLTLEPIEIYITSAESLSALRA
jgi:hypothetical protein